ncbi:hypothetical protein [Caminicella sporogenes]|uniref:hypothetical protein n=1 Tax=Caminicella sporogenes TaxID=166485 RepID=UPI00253F7893|nr:hypothetical protein [Caminicella sporogenes]WIF94300.1 hypothetical protein QNI18_08385 [Caminicella sporogenes]
MWLNDDKKYHMILQNDVDSLVACSLLARENQWQIKGYYDFKGLYIDENTWFNEDEFVGVDIDFVNLKCISNHVIRCNSNSIYNENAINPNLHIKANINYYDKVVISTTLFLWAILKVPLPSSKLGQAILLTIDSAYSQYYWYGGKYKKHLINFLEQYNMTKLIDMLKKHDESDFERIKSEFNINKQIEIDEDMSDVWGCWIKNNSLPDERIFKYLELQIADLPVLFNKEKTLTTHRTYVSDFKNNILDRNDLFSYAITRKNEVKYSLIKNISNTEKKIKMA